MKNLSVSLLFLGIVCAAGEVSAATLMVNAGGDLQAAINAAKPGDTIMLQAGATFTGDFWLPAKGGTTYITIRSSAPDSALPPPGTRITPAYAAQLPKLRSHFGAPVFSTAPGASYWRLLFLEFLPSTTTSANLVAFGSDSERSLANVPHHLVIDRCYLHGDPGFGQRRGVALNSGQAEVINSYFSDFKQVNADAQALGGWNGPGPYLIENNYLEAAGENILFGGSDPAIYDLVPANITIRRNHITKPLAWRSSNWTIKNLIELKNARDVLIEGNIIENNWASGQQGYAVLFTPRNQYGGAPWSVVRNVVVQNNIIRHVAGGFNILGHDNLAPTQQTRDILIRNNLLHDVSTAYDSAWGPAPAVMAVIGGAPRNITIDHNTVDNNGGSTIAFYYGDSPTDGKIYGFTLTNNLLRHNTYGVFGADVGSGTAAFTTYTPNAVVLRNTFAGAPANQYPTGNYFPSLQQWLADFVNVGGADYRLASTSASQSAGLDGKNLGVDFAELNAALSNSVPAPAPPPPPPPAGSTPKNGSPIALPGTIQAEDFDNGGANVAYRDLTSGNSGGAYRSTDVDIESTSDAGGGFNVGWMSASEWLQYTVSVGSAGTFTLDARIAASGSGGTFHLEIGGTNLTGPLTIPNTGGWQNWTTISKSGISLPAGTHLLRLVVDGSGPGGGAGNLNWLKLSAAPASGGGGGSTPYSGAPATVPGTIQAEHFDNGGATVAYLDTSSGNSGGAFRSGDVDIEATSDSGGGYNVGWVSASEWLNYSVNVGTAGTFTFEARVASSGAGGTFHLEANGVNVTGPLTVPNTGGWQNWTTVTKSGVSLAAGTQQLRLVMDSNGSSGGFGNFNWLRLTQSATGSGGSTPYTGTPAPVPGTIQMEHFDNGGANVAYRDASSGNSGGALRSTDVDIEATGDSGGGHNIGWTNAGEWLAYTVSAAAAGSYTLEVRVASTGSSATFHLEVNGVDRTGPITVPNTGGWQNWTTVTKTGVALAAGTQVVRVVMDANGSNGSIGNFNWLKLTQNASVAGSTPYSGSPAALPGTVQAENFDNGGASVGFRDNSPGNMGGAYRSGVDVDIEATADSGGGFNVGWAGAGEWLAYTVSVATAGTYTIEARVAASGSGGVFHIESNGVDRTGAIVVPATGGWQSWTTIVKSGVWLEAGVQVLRLVLDSNSSNGSSVANINWIKVR